KRAIARNPARDHLLALRSRNSASGGDSERSHSLSGSAAGAARNAGASRVRDQASGRSGPFMILVVTARIIAALLSFLSPAVHANPITVQIGQPTQRSA